MEKKEIHEIHEMSYLLCISLFRLFDYGIENINRIIFVFMPKYHLVSYTSFLPTSRYRKTTVFVKASPESIKGQR